MTRKQIPIAFSLLFCFVATLSAQNRTNSKEPKIPEPEQVVLETDDKVKLQCTYFPPAEKSDGKSQPAVPFILLHDWDGDRTQLLNFAAYLQQAGRAVIVPDLRGHGGSIKVAGFDKDLDYKRFRRQEIFSVLKDIERCKRFLVKRNNEGKVNIDMLTVLAVGETAALATQWCISDWFAFAERNADGIKQTKDVKALILISPKRKIGRLVVTDLLKNELYAGNVINPLPLIILWGQNESNAKDAEYIYERAAKTRPDLSEVESKEEMEEKKTLYRVRVNESFNGVELLKEQKVRGLWKYINQIIENKVGSKSQDHPWKSREATDDN
ncbi:MAG: hypothetical protein AAF939_02105 [Planctomycetota bacterium]